MPFSGVRMNEGVESSWNGQPPLMWCLYRMKRPSGRTSARNASHSPCATSVHTRLRRENRTRLSASLFFRATELLLVRGTEVRVLAPATRPAWLTPALALRHATVRRTHLQRLDEIGCSVVDATEQPRHVQLLDA